MRELIDRLWASIVLYIVVFTMYYYTGFEPTLLTIIIAMYVDTQFNRR